MTELPRVVACMPAWNAAGFIVPVLESLAAQTYENLHVLISVDASTDTTADVCEQFAAAHRNVSVMRQPTRLGWIGNANALLRAAVGDFVFFAFHDDVLQPGYVAALAAALEGNPRAVVAFSDVHSNIGPFSYPDLDGVSSRFDRARHVVLQRGSWWVPNRGLIRASAVRALGGMRRHLAGEYAADLPWLLRLALLGEFVRVPEPLVAKAFRAEGLSTRWRKNVWNRMAVQLACLRVIREAGFSLSEETRLYREAVLWGASVELWNAKQWLTARSVC